MHPLNKDEVRKKAINFWLLFLVLVLFSIIPVYFFVWAASRQQEVAMAKELEYRDMYNRQLVLKEKIDSLYTQLTYVNTKKVSNYLYLEEVISQNKLEIERLIDKDSGGKFATYAHVLSTLPAALFLKDSIVRIENNENLLRNDLLICINKNKKLTRSIFEKTKIGDN
jgi:hypothetical protein